MDKFKVGTRIKIISLHMQIKEYFTNDIKANELNEKVNEMLTNLFKELNGLYCTRFVINKYVPVIEQLTSDYNNTFNKKCYITSYKNNTMNDYIGRKSSRRLKYSIDSYFKAVQFEVALLLAKYQEIHECQIKLAFMNTLLSNYMYYTIVAFDNSYSLEFDINIIILVHYTTKSKNTIMFFKYILFF